MHEPGFSEIVLIFCLALIVLGPKKLPRVAAQVGRLLGRARAMARQFRDQLEQEAAALEAMPAVSPAKNSNATPGVSPSAPGAAQPATAAEEADAPASTAAAPPVDADPCAHHEQPELPDFKPPEPGSQGPSPASVAAARAADYERGT
jgi:sec-independent protein translocase protein TatB